MSFFIILKQKHPVTNLASLRFFSNKIFLFWSYVSFEKSKKFVTNRIIIIIFFKKHLKSWLNHFFNSFFMNIYRIYQRSHTFLTKDFYRIRCLKTVIEGKNRSCIVRPNCRVKSWRSINFQFRSQHTLNTKITFEWISIIFNIFIGVL